MKSQLRMYLRFLLGNSINQSRWFHNESSLFILVDPFLELPKRVCFNQLTFSTLSGVIKSVSSVTLRHQDLAAVYEVSCLATSSAYVQSQVLPGRGPLLKPLLIASLK